VSSRLQRVHWSCSRPGCGVTEERPPHLAKKLYCTKRCAGLVNGQKRYGSVVPASWNNFAERYRRDNEVGSLCEICGLEEFARRNYRHHLDHDHRTGVVRGLLCQGCNLHLGRWEQRSALLRAYLEQAEAVPVGRVGRVGRSAAGKAFRLSRPQVCAACSGKPKNNSLSVDHCHERMVIRGLLCVTCNVTLGWYEMRSASVNSYLGKEISGDHSFSAG
jgi:hypothetical protein